MKNFFLNVLIIVLFLAGLAAYFGATVAYLTVVLGFFEDLILSRIHLWPQGYQTAVKFFLFMLAFAPPLGILIAILGPNDSKNAKDAK
jgi:hypothetical protein